MSVAGRLGVHVSPICKKGTYWPEKKGMAESGAEDYGKTRGTKRTKKGRPSLRRRRRRWWMTVQKDQASAMLNARRLVSGLAN